MDLLETSIDTQAVLLLMARFATRRADDADPLTHGEYNRLAVALNDAGLRPADLMGGSADAFIAATDANPIDPQRLRDLLQRSMALAMAVESWANSGYWVMSRADDNYPARLRERLKGKAPVLLFGCGESSLLEQGGLAIVGSRNVDEQGAEFTRDIARAAAAAGIQVVSGGARGVDSISMESALDRGGSVVGVLANDLAKTSRSASVREAIQDDRLCLVSPFQPDTRFEAWKAMDRNKSIYALSDWAVVVSSDLRKGGTWAGAKENLDGGWVPLFVRGGADSAKGNEQLVRMGGTEIMSEQISELSSLLEGTESPNPPTAESASGSPQLNLFG